MFDDAGWIGPPSLKEDDLVALKTFNDTYRTLARDVVNSLSLYVVIQVHASPSKVSRYTCLEPLLFCCIMGCGVDNF